MGSSLFIDSIGYIYLPEPFVPENHAKFFSIIEKYTYLSVKINYYESCGPNFPVVITYRDSPVLKQIMEELGYEKFKLVIVHRFRL